MSAKPVAIIMGSQSDWATLKHSAETLDGLGVGHDTSDASEQTSIVKTLDNLMTFPWVHVFVQSQRLH